MNKQMELFYLIFLCFLVKITPLVPSFFLQQRKMRCLISIGNSTKRASRGGDLIEGGWLLEKLR